MKAFEQIATALKGYTEKSVISFVDIYAKNKKNKKNKKNMELLDAYELSQSELLEFTKKLSRIAHENQMTAASCAESMDLELCGVEHNCCIDKLLLKA